MLDQKIATLVDDNQPAGYYAVDFNARDLPSGSYLYRLEASEMTAVKVMTISK